MQKATSPVVINQDYIQISKSEYERMLSDYKRLELQLAELRRLIFGSKSERFIPSESNQLGLFAEPATQEDTTDVKHISYSRKDRKAKSHPVRLPLASHLPRVEEVIEPENLVVGSVKIGEEITELLEYTPSKVYVRKIVRPKYALPESLGICIAELPSLILPKSNVGAGLLAQIIVSKFVDHCPFYRQIQIFKRQDVVIASSTMSGWFSSAMAQLTVLYELHKAQVLQSDYLQGDESPIKVQDNHKKGSLHTGYHWVFFAPIQGLVLFEYASSRSAEVPENILQKFKGTLQTDGYKAYQKLIAKYPITLLACMAHARRYFEKALDNDRLRARYVLEQIQKLYAIERKIKERSISVATTKRYREICAKPILDTLHTWMQQEYPKVLPKSSIGKAFAYSLNLWDKLSSYIQDGNYRIDNNLIENSIRPLALGRKNYLFAGNHKAAQNAAMMYSFFATCKSNNVNPYEWLHDVFKRLLEHKANKLHELLPLNWKNNTIKKC
ncbi:IS66 family transposase [Tenacibaculum maritimum]|uniref:IS66 family transposase n=1 Tax=Tenacibaculum maritimum TaxID=107401 RepID=UPI0012E6537C|nr:IS66 family transposase [Tenacibaculum maritimum]CAA0241806.1 Transposase IS66 family, Transposase [Tenacibaculum maritimum]